MVAWWPMIVAVARHALALAIYPSGREYVCFHCRPFLVPAVKAPTTPRCRSSLASNRCNEDKRGRSRKIITTLDRATELEFRDPEEATRRGQPRPSYCNHDIKASLFIEVWRPGKSQGRLPMCNVF